MRVKKYICTSICACLLVGCQPVNTDKVLPSYEELRTDQIAELAETIDPATIYEKSNLYDKAVSVVFEGFADEETMMRLADLLEENDIDSVMFLPGVEIETRPDLSKYIIQRGIEIGNYGLSGEEGLASSSVTRIARQIYLGNEYVKQAVNKQPNYFMANRSEYTEDMLKVVNAADLDGVVKPSRYLNYKSFVSLEQATDYASDNMRGEIFSFRLSGELNETEVLTTREEDERPAIDKQPTITDEETEEESDEDLPDVVEVVGWFLEACVANNVEIISLKELENRKQDDLVAKEVPEELLALLDADLYPSLTTEFTFGVEESDKAANSYFDDVVMVGDSVIQGVEEYVKQKKQNNANYLGDISFLTMSGLSARNALWEISEESRHPIYMGERTLIQDAIGQMSEVNKVYIMLGANEITVSSTQAYLDNYQTLIQLIKQQSPQVEIFVLSITPGMDDKEEPNNQQIFERNLALVEWCAMYGYEFVDVATALRNENGGLQSEYCSDEDGDKMHLSTQGAEAFLEYILTHVK